MNAVWRKSFGLVLLGLTAGLLTPVVQAKTLLWLPLDEKDPGTSITDGTYGGVTNAVNPATVVKAYALKGDSLEKGSDFPTYAPRYVKPHTGIQVYDPVTGAKRRNRAAMRFTTGTTEGQQASYYGSALRIAGTDTSVNPKGSFTIECFFATRMNGSVNIFAPLIGKRDDSLTSESWALYLVPANGVNGKFAVRLRTGSSGARISEYGNGDKIPGNPVNDGNWHHVAYVYDKAQGKAFIYVDYEQKFSVATQSGNANEDVHYNTGADVEWKGALYIGGYPFNNSGNGYRKFNGNIDEVRISDEALSPEKFLRLQPEDDDELVHLHFDYVDVPGGNENVWSIYGNYNDRLDVPVGLGRPVESKYAVPDKVVKPAAIVRNNAYAESDENVSSFSVTTNAAKGCYFYIVNFTNRLRTDSTGKSTDFTVECFFKTRSGTKWSGKQHIFKIGSSPVCGALVRNGDSGQLMYTYNSNNVWASKYSVENTSTDGNWHHLAVVNDTARKEMRFYYDGKQTACAPGVVNLSAEYQHLNIGSTSDANDRQYFDGWIDDFRIVTRALRPEEFLCTGDTRVRREDPTVAFLNFENDWTVSPYPTLMGTALGRAHGSGAAPTFVERKRDWIVPSGPVTNEVVSRTAVSCPDSVIELPASPLFEQHAFTVELMANIEKFEKYGNLARYVRQANAVDNPVWAFYSPDGGSHLGVRLQANVNGVSAAAYQTDWKLPADYRNKWHHYALTVQEDVARQKLTVEIFYDGVSLGAKEVDGVLDYAIANLADGRVMWGASAAENKVYAKMDAFRFSRGVLTPDQFIRKVPMGGAILVR